MGSFRISQYYTGCGQVHIRHMSGPGSRRPWHANSEIPAAIDGLECVQMFFREEKKKGRSFADLYELVQHAGNVLPRL